MKVFRKRTPGRIRRGITGMSDTPKVGDRLLSVGKGALYVSVGDASPITEIKQVEGRTTYMTKSGTHVRAPYYTQIVWEETA